MNPAPNLPAVSVVIPTHRLGIIGEYIAKIYEEVKSSPVYLIDECTELDEDLLRHVPIDMGFLPIKSKA